MENGIQMYLWSDGWWVEEDRAWYVDGMNNVLFRVDMNTQECESIGKIPSADECTFRLNPVCIKCGSDIFCIPGLGESIWVYNLNDCIFTEIKIDKPEHHQLGSQIWNLNETIFIAGAGWNKIIEVSVKQRVVTGYYTICENDSIWRSDLAEGSIYSVSAGFSRIYQFDLLTKKVVVHSLTGIGEKRLYTIGSCHGKFWLSGYQEEIYIWDKGEISLKTINIGVDKGNGSEDASECYEQPLFHCSVVAGGYIWFIPMRTDQIIYVNIESDVLSVFELHEDDVKRKNEWGTANYLLQYVKDDRYIGLYSAKNSRILEIDTLRLSYQWKKYYFSDKSVQQYYKGCKGIHYEDGILLHHMAYRFGLYAAGFGTKDIRSRDIGSEIYSRMTEEEM